MNYNPAVTALLGDFDPAAPPPKIGPVTSESPRPRWSVMIPTFNCAQYLRQTLASVLAQDPGPEQMQIEVIDDCSTKDDPEAVVKEMGKGRVTFHRKEENEGATANFNTCIERSRGELVHILHGDDWVLPGFYQTVAASMAKAPTGGMAVVRAFLTNEEGEIETLASRAANAEGPHWNFPAHLLSNDFFTPGLVFRRAALEKLGGFRTDLPHVADWEITVRVYQTLGAMYVNQPLACYRFFPGNDTGKLAMSGKNILDCLRYGVIMKSRNDDFDLHGLVRNLCATTFLQAGRFKDQGNHEGYLANHELYLKLKEISTLPPNLRQVIRNIRREAKLYLKARFHR